MKTKVMMRMSVAAAVLLLDVDGQAQAPDLSASLPAASVNQAPVAPEELRSVKNISPIEDKDDIPKYVGKVIRLRVSGRPNLPTGKNGEKTVAWVRHVEVKNVQRRFGDFRLHIPPEGSDWFSKLVVDPTQNSTQFVYVRVIDYRTGDALGTKIVNGLKGPSLVW